MQLGQAFKNIVTDFKGIGKQFNKLQSEKKAANEIKDDSQTKPNNTSKIVSYILILAVIGIIIFIIVKRKK